MRKDIILHKLKHTAERLGRSFRWIFFAIIIGIVVGLCGSFLGIGINFAEIIRDQNPWNIYLLPFGGLAIIALYRILHDADDTGTNLVISAIHSGDRIPYQMAPLIFVSTIITHLFGGSAGWEGGSMQMGGSLGSAIGHFFRVDDKDNNIFIMCGMSAALAALFRTPLSAAILPIEMITVGVMHYSALVPCAISALVASGIASLFGLYRQTFVLANLPLFRIRSFIIVSILACLCAFISILFCVALHSVEKVSQKYIRNSFLRIFLGGCLIAGFTFCIGTMEYSGSGFNLITACFHEGVVPYAFLLKLILTALAVGFGFKGGELLPAMCTGACFGYLFGSLLGFSPSLCAALGMVALFCGVTNSPIAALMIGFEFFGFEIMPFLLITVAFSYMFSGYYGLYQTQRIVYSKYKTNYINKTTE